MPIPFNRRRFLKSSLAVSSSAAVASWEERALLAQAGQPAPSAPPSPPAFFPTGKIGKLNVSRLICGGNLISWNAHSRDLIYVSSLLKHYFTDEKICETLARCEAHGVNTAILRVDERTLRVLDRYRKKDGGKIQWIAQAKSKDDDYTSDAKIAIDHGALGVYLQGGVGDDLAKEGRVDKIGKVVDFIQRNQVVAGVAGHNLEVPMACEKAGLKPDFYMKTFNSKRYWSAGPLPRHDSVWEETPEQTKAFMQEVARPWIAFKVLGAGAIHPNEGFRYAFENGADFICVGMFDFQVAEDVRIALNALDRAQRRERAWSA